MKNEKDRYRHGPVGAHANAPPAARDTTLSFGIDNLANTAIGGGNSNCTEKQI